MTIHIANFTPDTVEWQHVGEIGRLEPDDILPFEDARAKHILNKWGARGLLRVTYEDRGNEDEKRKEAMKIYSQFWKRHISTFNQHNQSLKNENKPYVHPDPKTEEKAQEFGIELIGPWKLAEPKPGADPKEMESLKGEVAELKDMLVQVMETTKEATKQRDKAYVEQFSELDAEEFRTWVESNLSKIRHWPEGIQVLIQSRWAATQNEMWPLAA